MSEKTTNYGLTKPTPDDFYDVNVQNENMEIIDKELKKKYDGELTRDANTVLAAPDGSNGVATFRKLVADDLPTIPVTKGGTGVAQLADTTYTTARYRASALVNSETTPTTNGVINWTYK